MFRRNVLFLSVLACLPMLLAVPADEAHAASIAVANCNDSGSGSLRNAVAGAASGDTIDMTALPCREIDLTSGEITVTQRDLSLVGGPSGSIKVDAGHHSSVFRHLGTGWLRIKRMNIANGFYTRSTESFGGCLYSAGKIELLASEVHGCRVKGNESEYAGGGGIYAEGAVRVVYSRVTANTATLGYGGGIVTRAGLTVNHSHVSNNRASFLGGVTSIGLTTRYSTFSNNDGGAIFSVNGDLIIANSTISDNTDKVGSGYPVVHWYAGPGLGSASIIDSTISGNASSEVETVGLVGAGPKSIVNSTIAFNQGFALCDDPSNAATVLLGGGTTLLDSTIISNNSCSGNPQYSVGGTGFPGPSVLVGANNLITAPAGLELPADTITANPRLAPLADNGGPTKTHALPADSPAINNGNNEAGLGYDQRGQGFPRSAGGSTDIGAFERQQL